MTKLPATFAELRSWLHSYRIRNARHMGRTTRASIIIGAIDGGRTSPMTRRASWELAGMDPSLSWLAGWKPRQRVAAPSKGDGQ